MRQNNEYDEQKAQNVGLVDLCTLPRKLPIRLQDLPTWRVVLLGVLGLAGSY